MRTRYALTPTEYEELAKQQNFRCAICDIDVTDNIRGGKQVALSVDHKHSSGKIRALLCFNCNTGLGKFKDNPEVLEKAAEYLRKHNK